MGSVVLMTGCDIFGELVSRWHSECIHELLGLALVRDSIDWAASCAI